MNLCALAALALCGVGELPDGSLLFLEGSNKPVATVTASKITHVAVIRNIDGSPWIYEATPGQVRRVAWPAYLDEIAAMNRSRRNPIRLWAYAPRHPYTSSQSEALAQYMDEQLGRRYSMKGYLRGKDADGIHCANFAASALGSTGRFIVQRGYAMSPGFLMERVRPYHAPPKRVRVPTSAQVESSSWCERSWNQWASAQQWCSWAFVEAWMFCW